MSFPMCSPQVVPESGCSNIKGLGILSHQLGLWDGKHILG